MAAAEMLEMMKMMGGGDGKKIFDQFMLWRENSKSGSLGFGPSLGKAQGKGAMKAAAGERVCVGKLRAFEPAKQRGFIFSEDVWFEYSGMDVYAHQSLLESCGAGLGDTVAFFLHVNPSNGNPQASAPMVRLASSDTFAIKGIFRPSLEGGYGHLQSKLIWEFFGRDCYVNKEMAALLPPGAMVAFNAHLNKDKLPTMDNNCEWVEDDWEPEPGDLKTGGNDDLTEQRKNQLKGKGKGKGVMQNLMAQFQASIPQENGNAGMGASGQLYMGVVKSIPEGNNFGTISCEEVEKKFNLMAYFNCAAEDGRRASYGDIIEFQVSSDATGKPQATSFRILEGGSQPPIQAQPMAIVNGVQPMDLSQSQAIVQPMEPSQPQAQPQAIAQPMEVSQPQAQPQAVAQPMEVSQLQEQPQAVAQPMEVSQPQPTEAIAQPMEVQQAAQPPEVIAQPIEAPQAQPIEVPQAAQPMEVAQS